MKCLICSKEFKNNFGFGRHLSCKHKITTKQYYDKYLKKENEGTCSICKRETTFMSICLGYRICCSSSCDMKTRHKGGWKVWNKGKTKKTDKRVAKNAKNVSKSLTGRKLSKQHIENRTRSQAGLKRNKEFCKNLSERMIGHTLSIKSKRKIAKKCRIIALRRIEKNSGSFYNYNEDTIPVFKEFKKLNNLKNCYFATEPQEYILWDLGYSLDFIDFDKKLIIEIDEDYHEKSIQKAKDEIRENEIKKLFPDFNFLRFKEKDMKKILELTP